MNKISLIYKTDWVNSFCRVAFFGGLSILFLSGCGNPPENKMEDKIRQSKEPVVADTDTFSTDLGKDMLRQSDFNSGLKELKVIKVEKYIDTSSMYYPIVKDKCTGWCLTKDDIVSILVNSNAISLREWHTDYSNFPCYYKGVISLKGKQADFTINAGAFSTIILSDTVVSLGYKGKNYMKYFLDGRASPSEYNE